MDIGHIPIALPVVETVADDEEVFNLCAEKGNFHLDLPS